MQVQSPTSPNGTAIRRTDISPRKAAEECFLLLLRSYHEDPSRFAAGPSTMSDLFDLFRTTSKDLGIDSAALEQFWHTIVEKDDNTRYSKGLLGWLLCYSGLWDDPVALYQRLRPPIEFDPWPKPTKALPPEVPTAQPMQPQSVSTAAAAPAPTADPPAEKRQESGAIAATAHLFLDDPDSYPVIVGSLEEQHFLVVESLVNGIYAILTLLGGAFRYTGKNIEIVICDITGEKYLGFEKHRDVVYTAGEVPAHAHDIASEEQAWFLPLMEAVYRVRKDMRERIRDRRSGTGKAKSHRIYLVMRYYDVLFRRWSRLSRASNKGKMEALKEAWRLVYGHGDQADVDIPDAVEDILDEGGRCQVFVILTTSGPLSSVGDLNVSKATLNTLFTIVPGDAEAPTQRGFASARSILGDSRFEWTSQPTCNWTGAEVKKRLKEALKQGEDHAARTGDLIALISTDPPQIVAISRFSQNGADLVGYDSDILTQSYRYYLPSA